VEGLGGLRVVFRCWLVWVVVGGGGWVCGSGMFLWLGMIFGLLGFWVFLLVWIRVGESFFVLFGGVFVWILFVVGWF